MDHRQQLHRNQNDQTFLRNRRNQSGQAMAQFAVFVPFLFLMIFAVMDFAMAIYTYTEVSYSANAGARWASVRGSTYSCSTCTPTGPAIESDISTYVQGMAAWLNTGNTPTVHAQWFPVGCPTGANNCPGSKVQVQVQYSFPIDFPFLSPVTLPLSVTSQMVISQ